MKAAIVFLSLVACSTSAGSDRIHTTEANARLLANAVDLFRSEHGRLPTEREGLSVLIRRPSDLPNGDKWIPLLETADVPCDGWGREFVYVLDPALPHGFGVYSRGRDGATTSRGNDRDDINTWNARTPWRAYYRMQGVTETVANHPALFVPLGIAAVVLILWKGFGRRRRISDSA